MADIMEYFALIKETDEAETEREIQGLEERINKLPEDQQSQIWEGILARFPHYQSPKRELST